VTQANVPLRDIRHSPAVTYSACYQPESESKCNVVQEVAAYL